MSDCLKCRHRLAFKDGTRVCSLMTPPRKITEAGTPWWCPRQAKK